MNFQKLSNFRLALFLFGLSFVLRASIVAGYRLGFLNGGLEGGDTHLYVGIAGGLIDGAGFAFEGEPTAYISPFYPIFLGAIFFLFGENLLLTGFIQSILSSLVPVWIFYYTSLIFENRTTGFLAGLIAAINYEFILWANAQILTEPLYVFLLATALLFLVRGIGKPLRSYFDFAFSGFFFALAALTRPLPIGVALGIFLLIFAGVFFSASLDWKKPIVFISVFLCLMLPWGIRNYLVMDALTISSLETGHVLWLGNNPEYDLYAHPDFQKFGGYTAMIEPDEELIERLNGKSSAERNRIYREAALAHIKNHPSEFLKRAAHKNWNMWRPNFSNSSGRNNLISFTFYPLILFSALIGMFLALLNLRGRFPEKILHPVSIFALIFLVHIFIHSVVTGEIRFRVPLWVVLIPFSAFAFSILLERFRCFSKFFPVNRFEN